MGTRAASSTSSESGRGNDASGEPLAPEDFLCPITAKVMRDPFCLYDLASVDNMGSLAQAGAILPVVRLLNSSLPSMQARAGELVTNRAKLIDAGVVPALVPLPRYGSDAVRAAAASAVANVIAQSPQGASALADASAIPVLVQLLEANTEDVQAQAAWAVDNVAALSESTAESFMRAGAIPA